MQVNQTSKDSATVSFTVAELILLNNALNESLNGIEAPAFETRLGAPRRDAEALLLQVDSLLDKMR